MSSLTQFAAFMIAMLAAASFAAPPVADESDQPAAKAGPQALDPDDPQFAGHYTGRVTGPDGKPVHHARVYILPYEVPQYVVPADSGVTSGPVRAVTDADGRFEFHAPDMTQTDLDGLTARRKGLLIATADGHAPYWSVTWGRTRSTRTSRVDRIKRSDFNLQLGAGDVPIHGRFLDADGRPLAGARVRLTHLIIPKQHDLDAHIEREKKYRMVSDGTNHHRILYRPDALPELTTDTHTDANGRFTISGLGSDRIARLIVSAPSVVDTRLTVMTREAPDVRVRLGDGDRSPFKYPPQMIYGAGFTLKLQRGRTIEGRVIDRDTRQPIPGMWVGVGRENYPREGVMSKKTVTDGEGRFKITSLMPSIKRTITAASAPGMSYLSASAQAEGDSPVLIECPRGIPFNLKLVDEQGKPVEAEVVYNDVQPNPHAPRPFGVPCRTPLSRASKNADGTYQGFVVPGPGAVMVRTPGIPGYRPALVDPKAFFAPDRTDWTAEERYRPYGNRDTIATGAGAADQNKFAAIVLVNPAPDSGALELSATVSRSAPRIVSLVDLDGNPVVGTTAQGMTFYRYRTKPPLRAASFPLSRLHPQRVRRITFTHEDRQLIGFLLARDDGNEQTSYTVRMQPWAAVTGRIVDENGRALPIWKPESDHKGPPTLYLDINPDPDLGDSHYEKADSEGRFRIDKLIPGQMYSVKIYHSPRGSSETLLEELIVGAGELRNLGDVRTKLSYGPAYSGTSVP